MEMSGAEAGERSFSEIVLGLPSLEESQEPRWSRGGLFLYSIRLSLLCPR
jgi:hypothetical protein